MQASESRGWSDKGKVVVVNIEEHHARVMTEVSGKDHIGVGTARNKSERQLSFSR